MPAPHKTWFISDTHFDDKGILLRPSSDRPYTTVQEMNDAILHIWNSTVGPNDTVYHLGDFSRCNIDRTNSFLKRLRGRKILIKGNHDRSVGDLNWDAVHDNLKITVEDTALFLSHYPMREWPGQYKGVIHLYGHVHGNIEPLDGTMDVGFDVWRKPVQLTDIMGYLTPFNVEEVTKQRTLFRLV